TRNLRRAALHLGAALALLILCAPASHAADVPAPAGMGNYCSVTWASGGWAFASDTIGGDPCQYIFAHSGPGGTIQRKGLYANNNWNRVVYRCYPPNFGWVGIYDGWGNDPVDLGLRRRSRQARVHLQRVAEGDAHLWGTFSARFGLQSLSLHP